MFVETGMKFTGDFLPFDPYPKNAFLEGDETQKAHILKEALAVLSEPVPELTLMDYRQFTSSGNRTLFEKKYFDRRKRLGTLILAEMIENKNRYIDAILQYLYSICEETTWCLPAHNTYERDKVQDEFPDASRPVLDLFACETGATLSTALYLMGDQFDARSLNIRRTLMKNLHERIEVPYLNSHFWWMGKDGEPMNNWTIWCTQNVLITFFLGDFPSESRKSAFTKAMKSMDYFLGAYGEDGCCDEGAQYYRHAALCLFQSMNLLDAVTGDHFHALYGESKIRNMASYIHKVHVDDEFYINFSDCSPIAGRAGVREYLFADACGLDDLKSFAAEDAKKESEKVLSDTSAFYDRVQTYLRRSELLNFHESASPAEDTFFPSVGLFIARGGKLVLAVKAGDNDDSHNHNDTGSITVYKNGKPLLIDVGVESYTKKTFSPRRYEIWTMQSAFHNVMTFNGCGQKNGPEYRAAMVSHELDKTRSLISMELHGAYDEKAELQSYSRSAVLHKEEDERIEILDVFKMSMQNGDTYLSLMCSLPPKVSDHAVFIGDLGEILIEGENRIETEIIPIEDERLLLAWDSPLYRIRIYPEKDRLKLTLK